MNETIARFGFPTTLISDHRHWVVLLRPEQPTLGSLVLAAKGAETSWSQLPAAAFGELHGVISGIEMTLREAVNYQKINYMMLMMVDPHVHFHIIPRYQGRRSACGVAVDDLGWPGAPALQGAAALQPGEVNDLSGWLREVWRNVAGPRIPPSF